MPIHTVLTSLAFALIPVKAEPALRQVAGVSPLDQRAKLTIRHRHRGAFTKKTSHRRATLGHENYFALLPLAP